MDNQEGIIDYVDKIGYPVVIKPVNGKMGRAVYANIKDKEQLMTAISEARLAYDYHEYLVEKYHAGKEYRIYVVDNKVVAVTHRMPANITGDGQSSVKELINKKNSERRKNPYLRRKLIKIDSEVQNSLKKLGYNQNSILKKEERVFLRDKSNLSSGGDPIEAMAELSKEVKQIAVDSLKAIPSLPHAGIDIIVDPDSNKNGVVLEINSTAEISFHCFPVQGEAIDVPKAIIDYYFPESIDKKKANFYYDYNRLLEPLKTGVAEEVKVSKPLIGNLYTRKYIVTGKVNKVGYMNWIKNKALQINLSGYAKKIKKDKVEVFLVGSNKVEVEEFESLCWKGSKRSIVKNVESKQIETGLDKLIKFGFEVII
ncbi:acylphosphatase [Amphibacillus sp. Q70]|uniref:acylphosphatase n=1 Tax=Amphibacillus sp. Q70 TaxID=3453416 RepID=UPI003F86301F